jgi:hypothetical protein
MVGALFVVIVHLIVVSVTGFLCWGCPRRPDDQKSAQGSAYR